MNYQNLKCSELKDLLAKRGLPSHGKKNELLERLIKYEKKDNLKFQSIYTQNSAKYNANIITVELPIEEKEAKKKDNIEIKAETSTKESGENKNNLKLYTGKEETDKGNKKKIISINKEELNKGNLKKMNDYIKNLIITNNGQNSKYYDSDKLKNNETVNGSANIKDIQYKNNFTNSDEKKNKTIIPQIVFSELSLSNKNTLQKNISTNTKYNDLAEDKKRELRKKRFGYISTDDALESRAKRFRIVTHKTEEENKKKRAERFGYNLGKLNDVTIKEKRAERFGIVKESDKLKSRAIRFGIP